MWGSFLFQALPLSTVEGSGGSEDASEVRMDWITVRSECFENICISEEIRRTMRWRLGDITYFVDVEMDEATGFGRLLPSKELRDAYPDDDQFGASWIHGWV